jgi:hypothetical protein
MKISALLLAGLTAGSLAEAQNTPATAVARPAAESLAAEATRTAPAARAVIVPPIALRHVRLTVPPQPSGSVKHRLLDLSGRQVADAAGDTSAIEADVHPGEQYVYVPSTTERRALAAAKLEFPARYLSFDPGGRPQNEGGLFLRPARSPLVWDGQARAYTTELIVGYDFKDGREQPLARPKTVTLFAEGSNARIQADTVVITHSGTAGYQRVVLTTSQLTGDTLFTARAGSVDELKANAAIDREPGSLQISLPSGQIDAFGLGTGTLTVTLLALDGSPLPAAAPLAVHLASRRLRLPSVVTLPAGQSTATAEIRSLGYGADEIQAEVGTLRAAPLPVSVVFPVAAVMAAVAGGGLGGAARYLRNKHRKSSLLARRLVEGLLVGVLFVGAAWAGLVTVDLSAGVLSTPFGAFVLAAFSGYLGCVVLDGVAQRTFRGLKPA